MSNNGFVTRLFFSLLALFTTTLHLAQNDFKGLIDSSVEISYDIQPKLSQSFKILNSSHFFKSNDLAYNVEELDIAVLTEYQWHPKFSFGLGLKFRLENVFDESEEDELRFQEQLVYTPEIFGFNVSHRFRWEQRVYKSLTKQRFRYKLEYTIPLNKENLRQPFLKAEMETLLEVAKTQKPEFEKRLGIGYGWLLHEKYTVLIGAEYQLGDFVQDLNHELCLLFELEIAL